MEETCISVITNLRAIQVDLKQDANFTCSNSAYYTVQISKRYQHGLCPLLTGRISEAAIDRTSESKVRGFQLW